MALARLRFPAGTMSRQCGSAFVAAVDLAVRYDYEYWLKREDLKNPELFSY